MFAIYFSYVDYTWLNILLRIPVCCHDYAQSLLPYITFRTMFMFQVTIQKIQASYSSFTYLISMTGEQPKHHAWNRAHCVQNTVKDGHLYCKMNRDIQEKRKAPSKYLHAGQPSSQAQLCICSMHISKSSSIN